MVVCIDANLSRAPGYQNVTESPQCKQLVSEWERAEQHYRQAGRLRANAVIFTSDSFRHSIVGHSDQHYFLAMKWLQGGHHAVPASVLARLTDHLSRRLVLPEDVDTTQDGSDRPELERLIADSARGLSRADYTEAQIEAALGTAFGVDSELIRDGTYFVAEAGLEIVGCGGWSRRKTLFGGDRQTGRTSEPLDPAHDAARIRAFFVRPDWARRGIGRALLARCEEEAVARDPLGAVAGDPAGTSALPGLWIRG